MLYPINIARITRTLPRSCGMWNLVTFSYDSQEMSFSPREKYLSTLQDGGGLRVWRLGSEDLMAEACSRLTRNLTSEEWRNYFGQEPYHATCPTSPIPEDAAR